MGRWCRFMGVPFDAKSSIPMNVESNIKHQHKIWKKTNDFLNIHRDESNESIDDEEEEDSDHLDAGNIDFYADDYGKSYKLTSKIRDLSAWNCHFLNTPHRIFCRCGKPMVEQLCFEANGECKNDDDF